MINYPPHTIKNCVSACEYSQQTLPPASSWRCLWQSSSSAAPALWEAQRQTTITRWDSHWRRLWWQCKHERNPSSINNTRNRNAALFPPYSRVDHLYLMCKVWPSCYSLSVKKKKQIKYRKVEENQVMINRKLSFLIYEFLRTSLEPRVSSAGTMWDAVWGRGHLLTVLSVLVCTG